MGRLEMIGKKSIGAIAALGMVATAAATYSAGGGYGTYARLIGQHMGRFLPGKPGFVPQFMPGGGSLKMANYMYNIAPKNGTFIGMASPVLPVFQLIRSKGFKMDARAFSYIGRMATQKHVMMVRADTGVTSIEDIKKREITVAASGKGSPTFIFPKMMNALLGTKFKVITGYKGSAGGRFALEQGEAQSMTSGWISWKANSPQWLKSKFLIPGGGARPRQGAGLAEKRAADPGYGPHSGTDRERVKQHRGDRRGIKERAIPLNRFNTENLNMTIRLQANHTR